MNLHYEEYGNKDASLIVFLHGGGVSGWMWDQQIKHLTNYHCVNIDLPGQGHNKHINLFSIEQSADTINELISKLADGKTVKVIGFSLGAQVLIQMLSNDSHLIDYAIINSALVRPSKFGAKLIDPLIRLTFPLIKNRTFSKLQAKTLYINEKYFENYYNETYQMKRETLVSILKENMLFKIPSGFSKSKAKILVTVGEKEKGVMKKSLQKILNFNKDCTGIIIPKTGHGAPLSKPVLFNQIIDEWINNNRVPEQCELIVK